MTPSAHQTRIAWFQRLVGIGGLALFASSWRLWIPTTLFPSVPLVYAAGLAPVWLQWMLAAVVPITLTAAAILPRTSPWSRRALLSFVVAYSALVLIDQQRLQPWAYQLAIMAIVLATACPSKAATLLRVLVVSIYAYSAIAKLDYTFAHTIGLQFLDQFKFSAERKAALALAFPVMELAIAISLAAPRLRRAGIAISTVMHLLVLLAVGPLGLNHKPAVLLWNVFFIVQNCLLFSPAKSVSSSESDDEKEKRKPTSLVATALVAVAIVWPLSEPWGLCDHWLAWGLYAPRASRVSLFIHDAAAESLPYHLQRHLERDNDSEWRQLYLDRWSLAARDVPIYPQARVQLGIAEAVVRENSLDAAFQIIRFGPADRKTGERTHDVLRTPAEIEAAAVKYLFNARATRSRRN